MIRLLITGNSHVGALKGGWDRIAADYEGKAKVEFFALPGRQFGLLNFDGPLFGAIGEKVVDRTRKSVQAINDRDRVDLGDYDHILLVGAAGQGVYQPVARLLRTFDIDGLTCRNRPHRLSWAALVATLEDDVAKVIPRVQPWGHVAAGRASLMSAPRILETVLTPEGAAADGNLWARQALPDAEIRKLLDQYDQSRLRIFARIGLRFVTPPAEVTGPSGFTLARFMAGAVRLAGEKAQPEGDLQHMNAEYGAIVLRDFLDRLLAGREETLSA